MAKVGILSWNNETSLSPYPLVSSFGYDGFIIDANFIQFDGFVPVLKTITTGNNLFELVIQFDKTTKIITIDKSTLPNSPYTIVIKEGSRYLGKLVLGANAVYLYDELANRTLNINLKFLAFLVKSIPSKAGVYKLQSNFGELQITSDENISYSVTGNNVEINAVSLGAISPDLYLKTVNAVPPTNNSLYIKDSDTIKITPSINTFTVSLRGLSVGNVVAQQNNTLPINSNP
jgi:hypothetical protein